METYDRVNGINEYVASGGTGTLTVTEARGEFTARYSSDASLAGTLRRVATTSDAAGAEAGQTLLAPCMVPIGRGPGRPSR